MSYHLRTYQYSIKVIFLELAHLWVIMTINFVWGTLKAFTFRVCYLLSECMNYYVHCTLYSMNYAWNYQVTINQLSRYLQNETMWLTAARSFKTCAFFVFVYYLYTAGVADCSFLSASNGALRLLYVQLVADAHGQWHEHLRSERHTSKVWAPNQYSRCCLCSHWTRSDFHAVHQINVNENHDSSLRQRSASRLRRPRWTWARALWRVSPHRRTRRLACPAGPSCCPRGCRPESSTPALAKASVCAHRSLC